LPAFDAFRFRLLEEVLKRRPQLPRQRQRVQFVRLTFNRQSRLGGESLAKRRGHALGDPRHLLMGLDDYLRIAAGVVDVERQHRRQLPHLRLQPLDQLVKPRLIEPAVRVADFEQIRQHVQSPLAHKLRE
jgi:hypothetical protein